MDIKYLRAVFWDYPKFLNEGYLYNFIKSKNGTQEYLWVLARFLEYGRVVDTVKLFSFSAIRDNIEKIKLSEWSLSKWKRLLKVYEDRI